MYDHDDLPPKGNGTAGKRHGAKRLLHLVEAKGHTERLNKDQHRTVIYNIEHQLRSFRAIAQLIGSDEWQVLVAVSTELRARQHRAGIREQILRSAA